jgi:hypothetical protein
MPAEKRPVWSADDADGYRLHATWSRSWHSLIFTIMQSAGGDLGMRQAALDAEQVDELLEFLTASLAERDAAKP